MNGLRVFKNSNAAEMHGGRPVFYSRRSDGPFYRWSYDDVLCNWQSARLLISAGVSVRMLATTPWKSIPTHLQRSIVEHYED